MRGPLVDGIDCRADEQLVLMKIAVDVAAAVRNIDDLQHIIDLIAEENDIAPV